MSLPDLCVDHAIAFNNAGVAAMGQGLLRRAWDLFKGALELNLLCQVHHTNMEQSLDEAYSTNRYVKKAVEHLRSVAENSNDSEPEYGITIDPQRIACPFLLHLAGDCSDGHVFIPFIFASPFSIPDSPDLRARPDFPRCIVATVVYNLAVMSHTSNRSSPQAVALYDLATKLVDARGDHCGLLRLALINNVGVWRFENGSEDVARRCMRSVASSLTTNGQVLCQSDVDNIYKNVRLILDPPMHISPAA